LVLGNINFGANPVRVGLIQALGPSMRRSALFVGLILTTGNSLACFLPPVDQSVSVDALIARTNNIVLAKVVRAEATEKDKVTYSFRVIKHIRGASEVDFDIDGSPAIWDGDQQNFDHHHSPTFWQDNRGRTPTDSDCKIHPGFAVGGTYLVFRDAPRHRKSYELIIRTEGDDETKDKWLQYVEDKAGPNNSFKPSPHQGGA
jgi:hypothetical protein